MSTTIHTPEGNFIIDAVPPRRQNQHNRPHFSNPPNAMVPFGNLSVHPSIVASLQAMLNAMHVEGNQIDDVSLKSARVDSGFRDSDASEGQRFRNALIKTIHEYRHHGHGPLVFGGLQLSPVVQNLAMTNLGLPGALTAFEQAVANQPGWNLQLARQLITITRRVKAPRGLSPHASGLAVDINFKVLLEGNIPGWHNMLRERNERALRTAAGHWLYNHAPQYSFDTYDTSLEIWHMEYRH